MEMFSIKRKPFNTNGVIRARDIRTKCLCAFVKTPAIFNPPPTLSTLFFLSSQRFTAENASAINFFLPYQKTLSSSVIQQHT
jgi:hypothetical protein